MRKLAPKTQSAYIRAVCKFTKFLGHSPATATDEDLRRFQLYLVDEGTRPRQVLRSRGLKSADGHPTNLNGSGRSQLRLASCIAGMAASEITQRHEAAWP
ncbi:phage integrase N-terminal SAM-like domain-containing protein, partial [Salmonella enterica]|uniref:phage integrase N-terminal SAM-like domain-containing protein n=1 Tax=Salmonella enterica TaxID=28901 RepID=UPI003FA6977B